MAEGMNYLHNISPSIIHRDLKPDNVIILDKGEIVKIVDFGLSQTLDRVS